MSRPPKPVRLRNRPIGRGGVEVLGGAETRIRRTLESARQAACRVLRAVLGSSGLASSRGRRGGPRRAPSVANPEQPQLQHEGPNSDLNVDLRVSYLDLSRSRIPLLRRAVPATAPAAARPATRRRSRSHPPPARSESTPAPVSRRPRRGHATRRRRDSARESPGRAPWKVTSVRASPERSDHPPSLLSADSSSPAPFASGRTGRGRSAPCGSAPRAPRGAPGLGPGRSPCRACARRG